ncbi:MAG: lytic transglycosylase domain-containing protein [Desulfobacteraceae bacterium]|nr:MAG: lytic transglycosylase domain-containing protein [Desulfobacteraceae bacterium]
MKNGFSLFAIMVLLLGSVMLPSGPACGETISFPLQIDYPFLTTLVIQSAFTDPDQTMRVTDPDNDCQQIMLSNPIFESDNNLLRIEAAVHLKGGTLMGGSCLLPIEWDGYLVAHMKPRMSPSNWKLSFEPVDSVLLDKNRRPDSLVGHLWKFFEAPVLKRMGRIRIAVNEPIEQLKPFLIASVPDSDHPRVNAMLSSLRPGVVVAEPEVVKIQVLADVETLPAAAPEPEPEPAPLSPAEIDAFIDIWETWDSFLVHTVLSLMDMPLTPDERQTLLTVLLDTRYRFIAELESDAPSSSRDFVREQFVNSWGKLSPILKRHLTAQLSGQVSGQSTANSWGYLAFFTASDALAALDRLGPVFNIEISRNGFIRLARMMSENKALTLQYTMLVDPGLRKLMGMTPPLEITRPAFDENLLEPESPATEPETDPETEIPPTSMNARRLILWGLYNALTPGTCWAESASSPSLEELKQWLVTKGNVEAHLQKVKPILEAATQENLKKNPIPENYLSMFQEAVYAFAWQESCFRQFILEKNKLTYIRSYTNTSVGIMQINERVWRGIYDINHLRWDISYNASAGVDILNTYLRKYALPKIKSMKGKDALDIDGVAGSLYAMYNAGPGGFSGYVRRRSAGTPTNIDKHFKEKYNWVKSGQWDRLGDCF